MNAGVRGDLANHDAPGGACRPDGAGGGERAGMGAGLQDGAGGLNVRGVSELRQRLRHTRVHLCTATGQTPGGTKGV